MAKTPAVSAASAEPSVPADVASTDSGQHIVVTAGPEERLIVDAGPGTGKTHTACIKVAALIMEHDIPPSRIWIG
jgi:superfamily I DNA/RNA helicase